MRVPKYSSGEVVHHKRYHYRGVIVGHDPCCSADDAWYEKNATRPDKEQPWYHVLVDKAQHSTYVAEENLEAGDACREVEHPLIRQFFSSFCEGRYYRESMN